MRTPSGVIPGRLLTRLPVARIDVGGLQHALAAGAGGSVLAVERHADLARPVEAAAAGDPLDLVLADQALEAGPHPPDHLVAPRRPRPRSRAPRRPRPGPPARGSSRSRGGRSRLIRGAPSWGCSRGGGKSRRSCPRRRGRREGPAAPRGRRPHSRRCRRRGRRGRTSWTSRRPWKMSPELGLPSADGAAGRSHGTAPGGLPSPRGRGSRGGRSSRRPHPARNPASPADRHRESRFPVHIFLVIFVIAQKEGQMMPNSCIDRMDYYTSELAIKNVRICLSIL